MISCVSEREKHFIQSNRHASQSISLPFNWPQRSPPPKPSGSVFVQKHLLCSSLLSSRQTKTACAGLKCDTRLTGWTAAAACPLGSRSFTRFLKWLPLISLMVVVPAETDKLSRSANVFFVHSVEKGCDRRYSRLQTSEES